MNYTPQDIIEVVNTIAGLDCRKKTRKIEYVWARSVAMRLLKDSSEFISLQQIGKLIVPDGAKGLNHATVIHSINVQFEEYIKIPEVNKIYEQSKLVIEYMSPEEDDALEVIDTKIISAETENVGKLTLLILRLQEELRLERSRNKSTDENFYHELNKIPEEKRGEFIESRCKPYLKMLSCERHYSDIFKERELNTQLNER